MAEGGDYTPIPHKGTIDTEKDSKNSDIKQEQPKAVIDQTKMRAEVIKPNQKDTLVTHFDVKSTSREQKCLPRGAVKTCEVTPEASDVSRENSQHSQTPDSIKHIDSLEGCNRTSDETSACAEKTERSIVNKDQNQVKQSEKDEDALETVQRQCPDAMLEHSKTGCEGAYGMLGCKVSTSLPNPTWHSNSIVSNASLDYHQRQLPDQEVALPTISTVERNLQVACSTTPRECPTGKGASARANNSEQAALLTHPSDRSVPRPSDKGARPKQNDVHEKDAGEAKSERKMSKRMPKTAVQKNSHRPASRASSSNDSKDVTEKRARQNRHKLLGA